MLNAIDYPHFIEKKIITLHNNEADCYIFNEVTSTFDVAYKLIKENALDDWASVLSYTQTAGRGQLGHKWSSPLGNLSATLRIPKNTFLDCDASAPIIGSILINFLKNNFNSEKKNNALNFSLKWTNDLLINNQNNYYKLGGILIEERQNALLLGIGINIKSKPNFSLENNLNPLPACALEDFYKTENIDIFSFWLKLVKYINLCYFQSCSNEDLNLPLNNHEEHNLNSNFHIQYAYLEEANKFLAFRDTKVIITDALPFEAFDFDKDNMQITEYSGVLRGISLEKQTLGGLKVDTKFGIRTFLGGTLRQSQF